MKTLAALAALFLALDVHAAGFLLAGERVRFDEHQKPQLSARQIGATSGALREGLTRWAATPRGAALVRKFDTAEYEIEIFEQAIEGGSGEAPQPGIATLFGAGNREKLKRYTLVLNSDFRPPSNVTFPIHDRPANAADIMAAAWAAEMLHIDFYSRGISLPHHSRADFQSEWRDVAAQLGYPAMRHGDDDDHIYGRRGATVIFWR